MEGFQEIPNEVSLLLNISNCQNNCKGCHTPMLREDIGVELTKEILDHLLSQGRYTCVCFMGEGNDPIALKELLEYVYKKGYKTAVYSGLDITLVEWVERYHFFPGFLKLGSYQEEYGPLNKKTTNQRLYKTYPEDGAACWHDVDITHMFWRNVE